MVTRPLVYNSIVKNNALTMRQEGYTYKEISEKLSIPKSTIYSWLHKTELDEKQSALVASRLKELRSRNYVRLNKAKEQRKLTFYKNLKVEALKIVNSIDKTIEMNIVLLSLMYWGEGEKNTSSGVRFVNSDPVMVKVFLELFRSAFVIDESKLKVMLSLHSYHNVKEEIIFWSKITNIHISKFYKPYIKPHTSKQIKENYHGTVSVRYGDHKLGKLIKMVYTELSHNIGV